MRLIKQKRLRAPELNATDWASDPVTLAGLKGRVVLLDFFSFGDPEGVHALPRIRALSERYRDAGLSVVGIHVPAYEFERPTEVARQEIWRLGVPYPVGLDHDFSVFRSYENRDLPARHIVDSDGFVRGWHHGPAGFLEAEKAIRALLREASPANPIPMMVQPPEGSIEPGDLPWIATPEIRFGTRGIGYGSAPEISQEQALKEGDVRDFGTLPEVRAEGRPYLEGRWRLGKDWISSEETESSIAVVFEASSVDAVVSLMGPTPATLELTLDGEALSPGEAGADVELEEGTSIVTIERGRVYGLISSVEFGIHNLEIRMRGRSVAFHLLFFGTTSVPEE